MGKKKTKKPEPNRVYVHLGGMIEYLAGLGADDQTLIDLFAKGKDVTIKDFARIEGEVAGYEEE